MYFNSLKIKIVSMLVKVRIQVPQVALHIDGILSTLQVPSSPSHSPTLFNSVVPYRSYKITINTPITRISPIPMGPRKNGCNPSPLTGQPHQEE